MENILCWVVYALIGIVVYATIGGAAAGMSTHLGYKESDEFTPAIFGGLWPISLSITLLIYVCLYAYVASTWTIFYPASLVYKAIAAKDKRHQRY